jgi:hypothetical protein
MFFSIGGLSEPQTLLFADSRLNAVAIKLSPEAAL